MDPDGSVAIAYEMGEMRLGAPQAWQEVDGLRVEVEAAYTQPEGQELGLRLGSYDPALPLAAVGGNLLWNTFLGAAGVDSSNAIAVDNNGNVYVTGHSEATWGAPVQLYDAGGDAYAAKLDSSGALIWNTFLGGGGWDYGSGIAVDGVGNVYVTGYSEATWGAGECTGCPVRAYIFYDAFAAKLNGSGALQWNTFLGGGWDDGGQGIAVDGVGNVYVTGDSEATWGAGECTGCPVRAYSSDYDAFAAKLDSSGALIWNTFLGTGGYDYGYGIALDGAGKVYVVGYSEATWGSPVRAHDVGANDDAFAAKLDNSGALIWNTFLGAGGYDSGQGDCGRWRRECVSGWVQRSHLGQPGAGVYR